jgi:hypothetical protein
MEDTVTVEWKLEVERQMVRKWVLKDRFNRGRKMSR